MLFIFAATIVARCAPHAVKNAATSEAAETDYIAQSISYFIVHGAFRSNVAALVTTATLERTS